MGQQEYGKLYHIIRINFGRRKTMFGYGGVGAGAGIIAIAILILIALGVIF